LEILNLAETFASIYLHIRKQFYFRVNLWFYM
jgi:hypothetical protein